MAETGENIMISVKEYAQKNGISAQAVYQQLKRKKNRENLKGHTHKKGGKLYLDADAVAYLEGQRNNSPAVIVQADNSERIQELLNENERLKGEIIRLQADFIEHQKQTQAQLTDLSNKILLLSERPEPAPKRSFWDLFGRGNKADGSSGHT